MLCSEYFDLVPKIDKPRFDFLALSIEYASTQLTLRVHTGLNILASAQLVCSLGTTDNPNTEMSADD